MTRTLRKGNIQKGTQSKKTLELKVNAENMSMNQGSQKNRICLL